MDERYADIYSRLYADYAYDYGYPRRRPRLWIERDTERTMILETRRAIEQLEMEAQRHPEASRLQLRPDAKLFLLSNFHLMVMVPLLENENRYGSVSRIERNAELLSAIRQDLASILEDAYTTTNEAGKREVSGHSIIASIDKLWRELKTTSFRIWAHNE